jgi:hypothetical protein
MRHEGASLKRAFPGDAHGTCSLFFAPENPLTGWGGKPVSGLSGKTGVGIKRQNLVSGDRLPWHRRFVRAGSARIGLFSGIFFILAGANGTLATGGAEKVYLTCRKVAANCVEAGSRTPPPGQAKLGRTSALEGPTVPSTPVQTAWVRRSMWLTRPVPSQEGLQVLRNCYFCSFHS